MSMQTIHETILSSHLISHWERISEKFLTLAAALPEATYGFSPNGDTRTVAEVLRHVAFWNYFVAEAARGNKFDDTINEIPRETYATRSEILAELKHSATEAAQALKNRKSGMEPQTAEMLTTFIEHTCEHYGQLAVYARLNGIVPPASHS